MRNVVEKIVGETVASCLKKKLFSLTEVPPFVIEKPKTKEHGDYATNIAFEIGRRTKQRPQEVAEIFSKNLIDPKQKIKKLTIAGGGFLNFVLTEAAWQESLSEIDKLGDQWAHFNEGQGKKVNIEFVSGNPTGPLHVGNARGGPLGDAMASLLIRNGYEATREYYVNDVGGQIDRLGISILQACQKKLELPVMESTVEGYAGEYVQELAEKALKKLPKLDYKDPTSAKPLGHLGIDLLMEELRVDLTSMGIQFDVWTHEKEILGSRKTEKVIERLKKAGVTQEKEGALWFIQNNQSLEDRESVLIRSSGEPTYFANDIAYHVDKLERGFDLLIDIWGSNHHGHVPRLKAALAALGYDPEKLQVILYQYVRVKRGAEVVKMSKRGGNYVTAREVLNEVGQDAFRFFLLMRSGSSHMDFDLELAKKQSADNPVFYVQYAHARICGIFKKAEEKGIHLEFKNVAVKNLMLPEELALIQLIQDYPHELSLAIHEKEPHRVAFTLMEVARALQSYYAKAKEDSRYHILSQNVDFALPKLYLLHHIQTVLKDGLTLLGVSAPERMDSLTNE